MFLRFSLFFLLLTSQLVNAEFVYEVRKPLMYAPQTPMLILLHGYGSNELDLFSFANQLPEKYLIISLRAPVSLGEESFAWYNVDFNNGKRIYKSEDLMKSVHYLDSAIGFFVNTFNADPNNVYLAGFSQGAILSYSEALLHPGKVKGIAALSGRIPDEIKSAVKDSANKNPVNIYISHGENDNMIKVSEAHSAESYLKSRKFLYTIHYYKAAHEINAIMLRDLTLWLRKQTE